MDRLTFVVQMLSFDPPSVVFPLGAECKRLFSQSAGRAAARLGQKRWDLAKHGLSSQKQTLGREERREKERGEGSTYSRSREVIIRLSSRISRRDPADNARSPRDWQRVREFD